MNVTSNACSTGKDNDIGNYRQTEIQSHIDRQTEREKDGQTKGGRKIDRKRDRQEGVRDGEITRQGERERDR